MNAASLQRQARPCRRLELQFGIDAAFMAITERASIVQQ